MQKPVMSCWTCHYAHDIQEELAAENSTVGNTTAPPPPPQPALYQIGKDTLLELVNRTNVEFVPSSGNVPYYIVMSKSRDRPVQVFGLIYLTTDVAPDWTYGFNSRVQILVFVNQTGTIRSVRVWNMQESWGFLITSWWLNAFVNRSVYEPLEVGQDVDAVTHASYTSRAIASGVREAGRIVVDDYRTRELAVEAQTTSTSFTNMTQLHDLAEATVITGMFVLAVIAFRRNDGRLKYAALGGAIISIGVYTGRMISVVDLTMLVSLSLPPLFSNVYWYSLYGWTVVTSFIWGRLYCGYLCPYGAFTQIINKISPLRARIPIKVHSKLVYVKYPILAIVVVGVLTGNSWIIGVEPFQTFFFLKGDWWMWAIMIAAMILSVPFNRLYCHYVCPIGALLSLLGRARVMEIRRWPECDGCKVCEQTCPEGAIVGPSISVLECMNCRECEKNYLDVKICPHYGSERLNSQRQTLQLSLSTVKVQQWVRNLAGCQPRGASRRHRAARPILALQP